MSDTSKLYANMTTQGPIALKKRKDELKKLKSLGVDEIRFASIATFYRVRTDIKVGNVSACLSYLIKVLKKIDYNEEQIKEYINRYPDIYVKDYNVFKERLMIFNKCGKLRYVLNKKPGLLYGSNNEYIKKYIENQDYKISEDELDTLFLESEGRVKVYAKTR